MQKKTKINWVLDPGKCLSRTDAVRLIRTAKLLADKALSKGYRISYRDYFVINLALSTGLRVMEIAQLNCSDLFLEGIPCFILVRNGKGNKSRLVQISQQFKNHCLQYLSWKESIGEFTESSAPLILSSGSRICR